MEQIGKRLGRLQTEFENAATPEDQLAGATAFMDAISETARQAGQPDPVKEAAREHLLANPDVFVRMPALWSKSGDAANA